MPDAAAIEAIERATLQAVAPERVESLGGWLLPMDHGTVGRARSAVPLHHGSHELALLPAILARYTALGFVPRLRLPDLPAFLPWHEALARRGWQRLQPTLTLTGDVQPLLAAPGGPPADLDSSPDDAWMAMFLGAGLDPDDGASRSRLLARATGTLYASVREQGQTVACGAASFGHGWLGVHGMRTAAARRGEGLAGRILHAMATEASRRGVTGVFLQVDASNLPALALYRRAGLTMAWPYAYWRCAVTD
ncbi:MAG: GNAT family N-acetyltransferase [Hydrogenophaga sp.]|uniref:GNAT family N-acetyltransferase n=1 Tax=Hydrogenophaga sp. TaxID=1904254 RepID=UPI00262FD755|nr:GNAT family N-acetyltransferase [Hydrogenophaga sp.]MDM7941295.1 GNAT family N-acetyltransferase [Hydrogenophaga sp.]